MARSCGELPLKTLKKTMARNVCRQGMGEGGALLVLSRACFRWARGHRRLSAGRWQMTLDHAPSELRRCLHDLWRAIDLDDDMQQSEKTKKQI